MPCQIDDSEFLEGMRIVRMQNDLIEMVILVDRGSDIYSLTCKVTGEDLLLKLPGRLKNPLTDFSQQRDTHSQFEDYYYGGWQEILPNSAPMIYRGASLGQHGEVSLIPWRYEILLSGKDLVSLKVDVSPLRFPIRVEKVIELRSGQSNFKIQEKVTNLSSTKLDFMWGHHIAFGRAFLLEGATIECNARKIRSAPDMPEQRRFLPEIETEWPMAKNLDGKVIEANIIEPYARHGYSEFSFMSQFDEEASYHISSKALNLTFQLTWDSRIFSTLWYWQECHGMQDFPWWGECYTVALEPWSSPFSNEPHKDIEQGRWLNLAPHGQIETTLHASIKHGI